MFGSLRVVFVFVVAVFAAGCDASSNKSLVLPEGDAEHGEQLFVNLQCTACHTVQGLEFPPPDIPREYTLSLGGRGVKTYPELVTSIINPSHRLARRLNMKASESSETSPMTVYNDVMTVSELVDIVAFLESQYKIEHIARYRYVPYKYDSGTERSVEK